MDRWIDGCMHPASAKRRSMFITARVHACVHAYMRAYMHTYVRMHAHAYIQTYVRARMHKRIHKYIGQLNAGRWKVLKCSNTNKKKKRAIPKIV